MTAARRFGQLLREARQLRGISAQYVAIETGIPLGHLEALEAGDLLAIPGGMYRRAEVRAYADAVGLDPRMVLEGLQHALEPERGPADTPSVTPSVPLVTATDVSHRPPRRQWGLVVAFALGGATLLFEQASTPAFLKEWAEQTPAVVPDDVDASAEAVGYAINEPVRADGLGMSAYAFPSPTPPGPAAGATIPDLRRASPMRDRGSAAPARRPAPALVVHTTPRGARVTVNGIGWGNTPAVIRHLPAGVQRVRVVKEQFVTEERIVELIEGQSRRVAIPLRRAR
jgi:cytoskeletal protein RodZ